MSRTFTIMKRYFSIVAALFFLFLFAAVDRLPAQAPIYWVLLADKAGTTFDPYSYFDAKAIERYRINNADLYDISNYPLNESYVQQVEALASEQVGQSRWLNAVAVGANPQQVEAIEALPFVREVIPIESRWQYANSDSSGSSEDLEYTGHSVFSDSSLTDQLLRMNGNLFVKNHLDGSGIRIAVFDGGFHGVDTHKAFKHLRDNKRIIATWDFTKKQAKVYDNHTHGTMVLSCITGIFDGRLLGLATGAEFLLAKTEVDPEPYKEEVWWMEAVEWADKNGADLINSSLGYTKDRHYTWEMDGRSLVSRAANMAVRKGMVVCNSAGNSGADEGWKIIGCPADADSILSIGGIAPSLTSYQHIAFSSYGPTADRRLKPNVCNFGYAECADAYNDTATKYAAGTSFSSPLTTGFVACAMQKLRDRRLTAMQIKEQIEHSADLYPYYDYAFGYGVPQADYFVDSSAYASRRTTPTFTVENRNAFIMIRPTDFRPEKRKIQMSDNPTADDHYAAGDVVMLKIQDSRGRIEHYVNLEVDPFQLPMSIAVPKAAIGGYTLVAHVNGYTESFTLSRAEKERFMQYGEPFSCHIIDTNGYYQDNYKVWGNRSLADNKVSNWGVGQKHLMELYAQYGMYWCFDNAPMLYGHSLNLGLRYLRSFRKWYGIGAALDVAVSEFRYDKEVDNRWDNAIGLSLPASAECKYRNLTIVDVNLEIYQRFRLISSGVWGRKGLHADLGLYGGIAFNQYDVYCKSEATNGLVHDEHFYHDKLDDISLFQCGLTTRLNWNHIGLYARYRLNMHNVDIPAFQFGLQYTF